MNKPTIYPNWKEKISYGEKGPKPAILMADDKVKFVLAALKPGQQIPPHAEAQSMFHFLEGKGWMTVDDERHAVSAGTIIVMPKGTVRGIEAETELIFTATRVL